MKEWGRLCQKGGSLHQVPKSSLCLWTAVRENEPDLLPGIYWAPTRCSECSIPFVRRRLRPSLFLTNLRLFEMETDGDLVFYQDKESKMWNGIMKKIYTYFRIHRNPGIYKHWRLWGGPKRWWIESLCPSICALFLHRFSAGHLVGYGMNTKGERQKESEQGSCHFSSGDYLGDLFRSTRLSPFKSQEFSIPHCLCNNT